MDGIDEMPMSTVSCEDDLLSSLENQPQQRNTETPMPLSTEPLNDLLNSTDNVEPLNDLLNSTDSAEPLNDLPNSTDNAEPLNDLPNSTDNAEPLNNHINSTDNAEPLNDLLNSTDKAEPFNGLPNSTDNAEPLNDLLNSTDNAELSRTTILAPPPLNDKGIMKYRDVVEVSEDTSNDEDSESDDESRYPNTNVPVKPRRTGKKAQVDQFAKWYLLSSAMTESDQFH